jgi:hypothetical protein
MIICIDTNRETKELMDSFVERGDYRDYAEVIESAVKNLNVLRSHMATEKAVVLEGTPSDRKPKAPPTKTVAAGVQLTSVGTPDIFQLHTTSEPHSLAALPAVNAFAVRYLPPQWLFGQYNKLLPVKATCRAFRTLLESAPDGVDITEATDKITDAAVALRQMLLRMDVERASAKGESLAAGFPGAEVKARLRFANQFVGAATRAGSVSGFPADLKLLGVVSGGRKVLISLTREGWDFTSIENPILDHNDPSGRLSEEEATFLVQHIAAHVPAEKAAFLTVLAAIANGYSTPDELDAALREFVGSETEITTSHLATQRAGAVARLFDLNLIGREKNGLFVRYYLKDQGNEFLERERE